MKDRRGADDAIEIARAANRVLIARGKKVLDFNMKKDAPDDETLLKGMIGPSGNLRAPTIRAGKTVIVGFHDEVYGEVFG
ncbi:MAG TPA: hypothetical protein EYN79_06240 [Planctomycetes bacterium]|nr:hypothetical protein [Planctomycetota bacterium]HIN81245.1 hypothetical protein [Planctomycetota bacterium]